MNDPPNSDSDSPRRWQPRFTIGALLLVMLIFAVMAASVSYLVRGVGKGGNEFYLIFIVFTVSAPVLLMVVVSLVRQLIMWLNRPRKP